MKETILRARRIITGTGIVLENGYVKVSGKKILEIGRWPPENRSRRYIRDLGDSILIPGLINAHCHLCFTGMVGKLKPTQQFHAWVKAITQEKNSWTLDRFLRSWLAGAQMLLDSGVTTVLDIVSVPELFPAILSLTPLRVIPFLEVTGIKCRIDPSGTAQQVRQTLLKWQAKVRNVGLSPHAPYSTTPRLLQALAEAVQDLDVPIMMHVAESKEEYQMFVHAKGPMYEWLARNEREMSDCGGLTPVQHVAKHWPDFTKFLMVHANYLTQKDIQFLAEKRIGVIHCPRSHKYFGHDRFPWQRLWKARIPVFLGTDSLASVEVRSEKATPSLDMFEEMRTFADSNPGVPPSEIVLMNMREQIPGLPREIGKIEPGARADIVVIPDHAPNADPYESVLHHKGPVKGLMIDGRWILSPYSLQ